MRRLADAALVLATVHLAACGHGDSGRIDVDRIQSHANAVEQQLREMRAALRARDLERARTAHRNAEEVMREQREALSAHPELGELEQSLREGGEGLCYAGVDIALERFFQAVRDQQGSEARARLAEAGAEHARCLPLIQAREDYLPLKLNLDSAPQALEALERELARPGLGARLKAALESARARLGEVDGRLARLEAEPLNRDLAAELHGELQDLGRTLALPGDLAGEPEWQAAAPDLVAAARTRTERLDALVRRGKLRWLAERDLPESARLGQAAAAAAKAKAQPEVRAHLQAALGLLEGCQRTVAEVLGEEPGLARSAWSVDGKRRTPAWLQGHCKREAARLAGWLKRLDRPPPPPPKPRKTGRRIQRW
jgi:hypothetical protein